MMTSATLIEPRILKELIQAGAVSSARVEVADKGLVVVLRAGMNDRVLGAARGGLRYFRTLDGAASVLQSYGILRFDCHTEHWVPRTILRGYKTARPLTRDSDIDE